MQKEAMNNEIATCVPEDLLENVRAAKPNGGEAVRSQLNRSSFIMGKKIPSGKFHERSVALQLIEVGVSSGLSKEKAADVVARGISDGKEKAEREIADRERKLASIKDSWGVTSEEAAASDETAPTKSIHTEDADAFPTYPNDVRML